MCVCASASYIHISLLSISLEHPMLFCFTNCFEGYFVTGSYPFWRCAYCNPSRRTPVHSYRALSARPGSHREYFHRVGTGDCCYSPITVAFSGRREFAGRTSGRFREELGACRCRLGPGALFKIGREAVLGRLTAGSFDADGAKLRLVTARQALKIPRASTGDFVTTVT